MHNRQQREKKRLDTEDAIVDPYEVLNLERTATEADIKKAYFARVREHPPERNPEQFKRIRSAYDMLRTPVARAATDLFLLQPPLAYEPYKRAPSFSLDFDETDKLRAAQAQTDLHQTNFRDDFRDIKL
jgi:curved DNA-binding protein CbpA